IAQQEIAAGQARLATVQASLDQTRSERDTLRADLDRAQRTIRGLEPETRGTPPASTSAPASPGSWSLDADPAPSARRSRPNPASASPQSDPVDAPDPSHSLARSPTPSITLPRPPKRTRSPFDALFGPLGGVPLTTSARSIPWELTVRLRDVDDSPARLSDIQVTLRFDLEDEGLAINGRRRGPLTLSQGASLTAGRPLHIQVSLSTGVHSDTPEADRPPAVPGKHRVIIAIQYRFDRSPDPPSTVRFSAHIPVISADG
ncbi:MAG TPA: hypothetical protein DFR83_23305, partial [Deltaproteobacteria bacterium]|nr:hypothetical protein [Deltaproteobacteria bacterium]